MFCAKLFVWFIGILLAAWIYKLDRDPAMLLRVTEPIYLRMDTKPGSFFQQKVAIFQHPFEYNFDRIGI